MTATWATRYADFCVRHVLVAPAALDRAHTEGGAPQSSAQSPTLKATMEERRTCHATTGSR